MMKVDGVGQGRPRISYAGLGSDIIRKISRLDSLNRGCKKEYVLCKLYDRRSGASEASPICSYY
jgi:hypothetical protein